MQKRECLTEIHSTIAKIKSKIANEPVNEQTEATLISEVKDLVYTCHGKVSDNEYNALCYLYSFWIKWDLFLSNYFKKSYKKQELLKWIEAIENIINSEK